MQRRSAGLPLLFILAILFAPLTVEAQQTQIIRTIGFLGPPPSAGGLVQAFQQGLRDLGYVEGQNIRIEYRYTDMALQGHTDLFPRLAAVSDADASVCHTLQRMRTTRYDRAAILAAVLATKGAGR